MSNLQQWPPPEVDLCHRVIYFEAYARDLFWDPRVFWLNMIKLSQTFFHFQKRNRSHRLT